MGLGEAVDLLLGGVEDAALGAVGTVKLGIEEIHPVDLLEAIVRETHELQLLGIALLAAVIGHILLALGVQLGLGLLGELNARLLGPVAHHGVKGHRPLGILQGILAVGHITTHGGAEVYIAAHVGGQVIAVVGQPVEKLLRGHGLLIHGHEGGIGMDAAGLIENAVGALAAGHIPHKRHTGHQYHRGQKSGQSANDKFFHSFSPSVWGLLPVYSSVSKKSFRPAA